jgi:CCR4-NOT transcription complex subunit 1
MQLNDLPIHHMLSNKDYFDKIEKQLSCSTNRQTVITPIICSTPSNSILIDPAIVNYHPSTPNQQTSTLHTQSSSIVQTGSAISPVPKYKLSDFKPSIFQSLNSMLEINPNILLSHHHPRLRTYIHSPTEQAINESLQTVQHSLKVATSAAETIVRKDFLLNPDEQQLRTSARNIVAYLSSGLVLITARPALQEKIQSYIKTHLQTVLGISQGPSSSTIPGGNSTTTSGNNGEQNTNNGGTSNDQLSAHTRDMIQQAASEIAAPNIELCCCLLQRITISRAIQHIDQRLLGDIETRQRCRLEVRQLPTANNVIEFQSDRLPESIHLRYGPLSSHQLAIYEDFVHYITWF